MGVVLVVDVANVMGSRPDGWWRDRAGAASRLLGELSAVRGADLPVPEGGSRHVGRVLAVVEGRARHVPEVGGVELVRAPGSGDDALVASVETLLREGGEVLVVTADRGLRARLPRQVECLGPRWLRDLLPGDAEGPPPG